MSDTPQPTADGGFDYAGWMKEPPSREEFFAFLITLAYALDEHKIMSLEDLHQSFGDAITNRTVNAKQTAAQTYSLRAWLAVLHKLATQLRGGKASLP